MNSRRLKLINIPSQLITDICDKKTHAAREERRGPPTPSGAVVQPITC